MTYNNDGSSNEHYKMCYFLAISSLGRYRVHLYHSSFEGFIDGSFRIMELPMRRCTKCGQCRSYEQWIGEYDSKNQREIEYKCYACGSRETLKERRPATMVKPIKGYKNVRQTYP